MCAKIFYAGTEEEVLHHARPLMDHFEIEIVPPERLGRVATGQDLAIFFSEHFQRFRTAIGELKEKGCRTLYAIDGILEWRNAFENRQDEPACPWTMRPVLSDKVATIGRSQARMLAYWGNREKVELIGLPRLDSLVGECYGPDRNPLGGGASPEGRGKKRVLVTTAKWPAFTEDQFQKVASSLSDLKELFLEKKESVEVVWRLTGGLDDFLEVENSLGSLDGGELVDMLGECDALITTPSTSMLEGMLLDLPTAVLEYNDCPQLTGSAWQIRDRQQMHQVIDELLSPPDRKMAQQEYFLHDNLECRTPAIERLKFLVEQMLSHEAGRAPEQLVSVESPLSSAAIGYEFLFNGHQLIESGEELEWKAQIANLQRELAMVRERNELLEREFGRAQSTIENVFNNPVISPFIKAGELAGRVLGRNTNSG